MDFYPVIKKHISPSGLDNWYNSRGAFVRSYFMGDRSPETKSMRAGKRIHALIEGGLLKVTHRFKNPEAPLAYAVFQDGHTEKVEVREDYSYDLPEGALFAVLGIPDSYEGNRGAAVFVDYKSGKENGWDNARLAVDLKMKLTAWLVWNACGKPAMVRGFIEYIPTLWNPETKDIEPTGGDSTVAAEVTYRAADLEEMTGVLLKTRDEVNAAYAEWLTSTDEFVNQDDVTSYAELEQQRREIDEKMETVKERIADQMEFGKKLSIATPFGSFYFTSRKTYTYPADLPVYVGDGKLITRTEAEEVAAALSASKKKFETENDPTSITKSLGFKAGKGK